METCFEDDLFGVEQAKAWYEENYPDDLIMNSGNSNEKPVVLRKNWKNSEYFQNEKFEVVETDLLAEGKFGVINPDAYQKWLQSDDEKWLTSLTRLVILKSKTDRSVMAFVMCIAGNVEYLTDKSWKMNNNHYLKKEKDFTGNVIFFDITGFFNNGWRYEDGKVTGKILTDKPTRINVNLKSASVCLVTTYYTLYQECRYYPNFETATDVVCDPPVWEITDVSVECIYNQPNGSGGYLPPVESPCECNICPICGGCLEMELKNAIITGGNGTPTVSCPECSCPKIDVSGIENNEKVMCVFQNLIKTATIEYNPLVTSFLMNFSDDLSVDPDDVIFSLASMSGAYGQCDPSGNKYVITLNSNEINNRAPIEIAKTFIHEILHALIKKRVQTN
jgi:hypothetical protein